MVRQGIKALVLACLISFTFYQSWHGLIPGVILFGFLLFHEWRDYQKEKKKRLKRQFQDALQKMMSLFQAGYPLEEVFVPAANHVASVWGEDAELAKGFEQLDSRIRLNESAEDVLLHFGELCGIEEMVEFANLLRYVRRGSGDVCSVLADCASQMTQNYRTEFEIEGIIAAKRYEYRIMKLMPIFILLFIRFTSYSFVSVLYESGWGKWFMSGCLLIYILAWIIGEYIMKIEV